MENLTVVRSIESWPIARLKPYEQNARLHSDADVQKLAAHVIRHGFNKPIEVDEAGVILCGHRRLAAALVLGLEELPVIQHTHLDEVKKREYRLADNRLTLEGEWDEAMLAAEMAGIEGAGGDLEFTGFSAAELRDLELDAAGVEESPVPDPPAVPTSRRGDVWHLGEHRVICGDATALADLQAVLEGQLADCVWTDPPYNVSVGVADASEARKRHRRTDGLVLMNDSLPVEEFEGIIRSAFTAMFEATRAGAPVYVAHPDAGGMFFREAFKAAGFYLSTCLIWRKNAFSLGRSDYHWQHEPILYGWKPGTGHTWLGGRDKSTVFDEDKPHLNELHPTMKPVGLVAQMLRNSAPLGAAVLDPFGGSGSTLMACEALGLRARLLELDPRYVDVIVRRWQEATGGSATLAGAEMFEEVVVQRGESE
jgi:DNA modification methylase